MVALLVANSSRIGCKSGPMTVSETPKRTNAAPPAPMVGRYLGQVAAGWAVSALMVGREAG